MAVSHYYDLMWTLAPLLNMLTKAVKTMEKTKLQLQMHSGSVVKSVPVFARDVCMCQAKNLRPNSTPNEFKLLFNTTMAAGTQINFCFFFTFNIGWAQFRKKRFSTFKGWPLFGVFWGPKTFYVIKYTQNLKNLDNVTAKRQDTDFYFLV